MKYYDKQSIVDAIHFTGNPGDIVRWIVDKVHPCHMDFEIGGDRIGIRVDGQWLPVLMDDYVIFGNGKLSTMARKSFLQRYEVPK